MGIEIIGGKGAGAEGKMDVAQIAMQGVREIVRKYGNRQEALEHHLTHLVVQIASKMEEGADGLPMVVLTLDRDQNVGLRTYNLGNPTVLAHMLSTTLNGVTGQMVQADLQRFGQMIDQSQDAARQEMGATPTAPEIASTKSASPV